MNLLEYFKNRLSGRDLYIWGAHYLGLGLNRALTRAGLAVKGMVDKNPLIRQSRPSGLEVLSPEAFLAGPVNSSYVITAATLYDEEIAALLIQSGRRDQVDFCRVTDLRTFKYSIEVAGVCNLRCPSCPRGNFSRQPPSGFMSLPVYEQVLDKIIAEDPLVWEIELYRWGEPLLNPALPEMIAAARDRGVEVVLSTNLNIQKGLERVVEAGPRQMIISASGWGESYEVTHRGGRWELLLENLKRLGGLRSAYRSDMEIEIYYHVYKDRQDDFLMMKNLAADLGLTFRPTWAGLLPLDHLYSLSQGQPPNQEVAAILEMQVFPATRLLPRVVGEPLKACGLKNLLAVTPELEVPACSCWFAPDEPPLTRNFLATPLADLIEARRRTPLCRRCEAERLHHLYLIWHEKEAFA